MKLIRLPLYAQAEAVSRSAEVRWFAEPDASKSAASLVERPLFQAGLKFQNPAVDFANDAAGQILRIGLETADQPDFDSHSACRVASGRQGQPLGQRLNFSNFAPAGFPTSHQSLVEPTNRLRLLEGDCLPRAGPRTRQRNCPAPNASALRTAGGSFKLGRDCPNSKPGARLSSAAPRATPSGSPSQAAGLPRCAARRATRWASCAQNLVHDLRLAAELRDGGHDLELRSRLAGGSQHEENSARWFEIDAVEGNAVAAHSGN